MAETGALLERAPTARGWGGGRRAYLSGLALARTWLGGWWMKLAEGVVLATQITESVPPIPALGVLFLMLLANPLLHRCFPHLATQTTRNDHQTKSP